jgi:hypothetical protein
MGQIAPQFFAFASETYSVQDLNKTETGLSMSAERRELQFNVGSSPCRMSARLRLSRLFRNAQTH